MNIYSQLPDEVAAYEAIKVSGLNNLILNSAKAVLCQNDIAKMVQGGGHCLLGQESEPVRKAIEKVFERKVYFWDKKGDITRTFLWEQGIVLHVYGDSFFHSYDAPYIDNSFDFPIISTVEMLYPTGPGHGITGSKADYIGPNKFKYKRYVTRLYKLLGGVDIEHNEDINKLFSEVDKLKEIELFGDLATEVIGYDSNYRPEQYDVELLPNNVYGPSVTQPYINIPHSTLDIERVYGLYDELIREFPKRKGVYENLNKTIPGQKK